MRSKTAYLTLWMLGLALAQSLFSASASERDLDPVKVRLVADHSSVSPGSTFKLGVLFDLEPGWHIYWKYPGEAGLPTVPGFVLPDGFTISELNWPIPERFMQGPNLPGFGYHNQLLLTADVTVPKAASGAIEAKAKSRWLGCSDICVPGRKELSLTIKIGEVVKSENELFQSWSSRLPSVELADTLLLPGNFNVLTEESETITGELVIKWHQSVADVDWFPAPLPPLEVRNIKISAEGSMTKLSFSLFHPRGTKEIKALDSLLVYEKEGDRRGVSLPVRITD